MPRDRDDDLGEYDRPRKAGFPAWAVVLIVVGGVGLLGCGGLGVVLMATWTTARPPAATPSGPAVTAAAKKYTRKEFETLVMGKTEDEVLAAVGKPSSTSNNGGALRWYYSDMTIDPVTSKPDVYIQVCFERGKVNLINY